MDANAKSGNALSTDGLFWRKLAHWGASRGPTPWLRFSPPLFGLAFALALPEARRAVRSNVRRVLGPRAAWEENWDVARTFMSYASCLAEGLASERPEVLGARRRFRNGDTVRKTLLAGRGAVVATAHFGAWDVAGPLLARDVHAPVMVAMQAESDSGARELHDGVRERGGVKIVHVGEHPLDALPLLHHLRSGGVVAVQLDRSAPGGRCLEVDLFGRRFEMPEGPFRLAALARVPLLPLFVRRHGYLDYELTAGGPIELPPHPEPADLAAGAQKAAAELARVVYACPTQWFHFVGG